MEGESSVTRSVIAELDSWDIEGDQMEDESGVTRIIIDELPCSDMIKWQMKLVLLEASLMIYIRRMSKKII